MSGQLGTPDLTAVLVIDVQRKYTVPASALMVDGANELVARIAAYTTEARTRGAQIVWLNRTSRPQVGPGRRTTKLFGDRLASFQNDDMDPQDERLPPHSNDIVIVKPRHSGFYATDLEVCLRNWGVEGVVLAGVTTNVCVMATAFGAVARDLDVVVASDLTASLPIRRDGDIAVSAGDVQEQTLDLIRYSTGDVLSSQSILDIWDEAG